MRRRALLLLAAAALTMAGCSKREDAIPAPPPVAKPAFKILASSELKDLQPAFEQAAAQAGVRLDFSFAGALDIVERINDGEAFDAILPASSAYAQLALATKPLAREKLFYSRVALGVKEAKWRALGWERTPPTWSDIARAAASGQLRYGMTNPASSNSGMSALFAVASAAAGKTEDLAVADVKEPLLKDFLKGHQLTSGSSGWLGDAYLKNPGAVDALVNYEAVILRRNAELAPEQRLRLVYPRDGVISADYPLMLLAEPRRADYDLLVAAFKGEAFQAGAVASAHLRPSRAGVALQGLSADSVAELAFPNRLEVIDAVLGAYLGQWRRPATSIFVLDTSGSMAKQGRLDAMREALKVLAGAGTAKASERYAAFQARERVALIGFSNTVREPVWIDFGQGDLAAARQSVQAQADALHADGGTAIYAALLKAQALAQQEQAAHPDRVVSIVLLTDGANNVMPDFKGYSMRLREAGGTPAKVFAVVFGEADADAMREVSEFSGGRAFDGRKTALAQVFKEIRGYQ